MRPAHALPGAALLLVWGCNLVLGIEEAETIAAGGGVIAACNDDADCDDNNGCTADRCEAGSCANDPLDGDAPDQVDGDCQRISCQAGVSHTVADDADLPVDGKECTEDLCAAGVPSNPNLPGGTACSQNGGQVCNGGGNCTECFDNSHCTPPDTCGGGGAAFVCGCTPIPCSSVGLTCGFAPEDGCGNVLVCNNQTMDGSETDVDCGGNAATCSTRCASGKMCLVHTDCASGVCDMVTGTCQ